MRVVGEIDFKIYRAVTEDIVTAEVIITEERIEHIKKRHPNDFERFCSFLPKLIAEPDYILEANKPNTALVLKRMEEAGEHFEVILRLQTSCDVIGHKNSVITFLRVEEKRYQRYLRTKKILYKRR